MIDDSTYSVNLSQKKKLSVRPFKQMMLVDIREFYDKDGEELPTRKGISLTTEQFKELVANIPQIEKALGIANGEDAKPPSELKNEIKRKSERVNNEDESNTATETKSRKTSVYEDASNVKREVLSSESEQE